MDPCHIAAGLFETTPALRLFGGRESRGGRIVFPLPHRGQFERVELPSRGTLWSYTVQRIAPKSPPYRGGPGPFAPFALGYVDLPGACIVEARLTDTPIEELRVGLPMELTTVRLWTSATGVPTIIYAFRRSAPS